MPLLYPFVIFLLLLILATLIRRPERPKASSRKEEELFSIRTATCAGSSTDSEMIAVLNGTGTN